MNIFNDKADNFKKIGSVFLLLSFLCYIIGIVLMLNYYLIILSNVMFTIYF